MKVAACALNQTPLDWKGNLHRIQSAIDESKNQGADLVLFPELCLSGYGCEDYFLMPWVLEKTKELLLTAILPASEGIFIAIGLPWHLRGKNYNTLALCHNGKLLGLYAKQILASQGVFYENRWFHAWEGNAVVNLPELPGTLFGDFTLPLNGLEIGFEICEDGWHPEERPAVTGAARKAELILNASASNFARGKLADRHQVVESLKGRNQAWYLYANLLGNESGNLIFDGEIIFGKAGKVLYSSPILSMAEWKLEVFELDEAKPWPGALPAASDFEEFTAAASLGLKDYLRKSGSKGYTLSLSGGADSAACAVLVAEMLRRGKEETGKAEFARQFGFELDIESLLCCVYQASRNSGDVTLNAAKELALALGAEFHFWEIGPLVEQYTSLVETSLQRKLSWEQDDLSLQNIQARSRAPGIWMLANVRNHLLITTGNRSEADVGYCTMDGDTAGSLAPIAGVSKHFIRQWLVWARDEFRLPVLDLIIHQEPTAELRPGKQTDEGDLMPYELLERIEVLFLKDKLSPEEILERLSATRDESPDYLKENIDKFLRLWKRSQWKRERLAPSFHLDRFNVIPRSMGRFPVFCG
jgi:NAD+ synthase (glutamine-hydrolysing)